MDSSSHSASSPERPLPQLAFYSVEYPGYLAPSSLPLAIRNLGGQQELDHAFRRGAQKNDSLLELSLRPGNPFAHPIPGDVVGSNKLLLKVVKRKRKQRTHSDSAVGAYTAEVVGILPKTARFRSMVDFQYFPDINDPVAKLRNAMDSMDVDALRSYAIPPQSADEELPSALPLLQDEMAMNLDPQLLSISQVQPTEGPSLWTRSLRSFPPPLFSRQTIPQGYNFKANPASMISTTVDQETGEERKRMINKMRWKGYGPASILFSDSRVPENPPQTVESARSQVNGALLKKLEALFKERPIWTRSSLFNQLSTHVARDILNSKILLPLCCYVFQDGPWRDTLVAFSYDPRKDSTSRFYQRIYFRNANHPISRPSVTTRRAERSSATDHRAQDRDPERKTAHIFDGQTLTKETAAFQLCDITDPMLKTMIEDPEGLRETCHERDGWYTSHALEQIKIVLRHKFFSLLEGHIPTEDECRALLSTSDGSTKTTVRSVKPRPGKHNMAKGALRPEDAAALRLRATLDRNIKSFQSQRT